LIDHYFEGIIFRAACYSRVDALHVRKGDCQASELGFHDRKANTQLHQNVRTWLTGRYFGRDMTCGMTALVLSKASDDACRRVERFAE